MTDYFTWEPGDLVLVDDVQLARVVVPPYLRVEDGQVQDVSGYTYDRQGGKITTPKGHTVTVPLNVGGEWTREEPGKPKSGDWQALWSHMSKEHGLTRTDLDVQHMSLGHELQHRNAIRDKQSLGHEHPLEASPLPPKPAKDPKIVKVTQVVDTRSWDDDVDPPKPIPGSGDARPCDRCNRTHEIHVFVELDNGGEACIGSSCARQDEMGMVRKAMSSAATLNRLEHQLAKAEAQRVQAQIVDAEVEALPLPEITYDLTSEYPMYEWSMGDANVYWREPGPEISDERRSTLEEEWRRKRRAERTSLKEAWWYEQVIEDLQKRIARAKKSLEAAT